MAARLGVEAGKGAGGVDKAQHRQPEALGEPHQPPRLTVTLRSGHAEIALEASLGIGALLGAERNDTEPAEAADAADDSRVLGEGTVA